MKFDPQALEAFRAEKTWSYEKLARLAGVSVSTVIRAEKGQHVPEPSTVYALAGALNVDIMQLFIVDEPNDGKAA